MKLKTLFYFLILAIIGSSCSLLQDGKHLFILSGQSNMELLRPAESFSPAIHQKFGEENAIIVKDAHGGQPISRWYEEWTSSEGERVEPALQADLYDSLMTKVNNAIADEKIETVTFIWMQGERDARDMHGDVYEESLMGLYEQLQRDLNHKDINFIIGRLSDFDLESENYPDWTMIREIQMRVAESNPAFAWVNTDDLNDGKNRQGDEIENDLHMSGEGYVIMGERFADTAIELIETNK